MLYKLTDENAQTYGNTQWGEGVTHEGTGEGGLCGPGWIHAYTDPILAVMLNPIHADFINPRLWECEGAVCKSDNGLKVGCRRLTTIREIPMPIVSAVQRIAFGILCTKTCYHDDGWNSWADQWISCRNRSAKAADAARAAAAGAARAAADINLPAIAQQAMAVK